MRIQDEIQSKFENEHHKALVNLLYTYGYLVNNLGDVLKEYGITRQQFNVLRILRGQHPNPAPVSLIKERMLDKMSDASRILDRLRKKELIEKRVCKADRRSADVIISKSGLELLKRLDPVISNYNQIMNGLTPEEAATLNELLDKIRD